MSNAAMREDAEALRDIGELDMQAERRERTREIHYYDVPAKLAKSTGISRIGLVELTSNEELMATNRAAANPVRLGYELVKEAVRVINDQPVNTGDGSLERYWERMTKGMAQLRQLANAAYSDIHHAEAADIKAFLESQQTSTR